MTKMTLIEANWPAPKNVRAFTTLRSGGVSNSPYDSFNLAMHVGDDEHAVTANRDTLKSHCKLPDEPVWLTQTHSAIVVPASADNRNKEADAAFTSSPNQICAILTADCLPILISNTQGTEVAAIHAGWRGIASGIIENTLDTMKSSEYLAWLGPAIGPEVYEVGDEVRQAFLQIHPDAEHAFKNRSSGYDTNNRWLANLYALATLRLQKKGVTAIFGGEYCTFTQNELFYSYRRDGNKTGRMATLIWFE